MAAAQRTFEDSDWVAQLPVHLGERIAQLMSQIASSGEHASANETVAVIATTFGYLGRLWVAEYVHAGAVDAAINRDLLDLSCRPVLTGHWVSIARRIRRLFTAQSWPTVVSGLTDLDFGVRNDTAHPVTRLIAYRNSFSHGSLTSVVEDIRAHRQLMERVLSGLNALWEQPIYCLTEEHGLPRLAVRGWPLATEMTEHGEDCYQPFIIGADGQTRLRLYPLLHVASTEDGLALRAGAAPGRQHALDELFERETLRLWYDRYRREQQGHLSFDALLRARPRAELSPAVFSTVQTALAMPGVARVIVEAHPGCGKAGLVAHLDRIAPPFERVETASYVVEPGAVSQSGVTFGRFLLRRTEAALRLDQGADSGVDDELPTAIAKAEQRLSAEGMMLLVGVEDLHHGTAAWQTDTLSIADVFALPSGQGIRLLGTIHPGRMGKRLPCDRRIALPVPAPSAFSVDELEATLSELCPPDDAAGRRVLLVLLEAGRPLTVFGLCDAIEETDDDVFEPEIEQTLWRLRPLLLVDGVGSERQWQPLSGLRRLWSSDFA